MAASHEAAGPDETLAAMVCRTAFTRLGNSATVLVICTALMLLAFVVSTLALFAGDVAAISLSG